ncbi:hypothetical protein APASM_3607 [Actinosynnema pretiosum subsp. pretiosum]|nr:hypothetical protein APASM_3607 [Actinosynnema pretiosum subsp. pretiosum]
MGAREVGARELVSREVGAGGVVSREVGVGEVVSREVAGGVAAALWRRAAGTVKVCCLRATAPVPA